MHTFRGAGGTGTFRGQASIHPFRVYVIPHVRACMCDTKEPGGAFPPPFVLQKHKNEGLRHGLILPAVGHAQGYVAGDAIHRQKRHTVQKLRCRREETVRDERSPSACGMAMLSRSGIFLGTLRGSTTDPQDIFAPVCLQSSARGGSKSSTSAHTPWGQSGH